MSFDQGVMGAEVLLRSRYTCRTSIKNWDITGDRTFLVYQGHIATQTGVFRLVDHTHATATELLCDFVVGDGLVDHARHSRLEVINALVWLTAASISNSRPFIP